jgi:hypothetical protein
MTGLKQTFYTDSIGRTFRGFDATLGLDDRRSLDCHKSVTGLSQAKICESGSFERWSKLLIFKGKNGGYALI